jgi:quinoprotein glucose dehydrogenase
MRSILCSILALSSAFAQENYRGWPAFGGGPGNIHYSSLKQVNKKNVGQLKVAWIYDSDDSYANSDIQCNPIFIEGVIYITTARLRVVALDASTGKEIWSFDPSTTGRGRHKNRGLTYWTDGKQSRILFPFGTDLLSIDAKTGKLDPAFGNQGKVDMRAAFDRPPDTTTVSVTTPGVIYKNLVILGSSVPENLPSTPGDIRAYDVLTGELKWNFHTIPRPGEFGDETWPADTWKHTGGANNWAGMVVDQARGTVFVPTGSAAFDFYGADRHGDNLFANTILALDAATGKRKWHFQTVKHDVWDLDFPQAPLLVTVKRNGKSVDAVAQAGKDGYVYVLNRDTGESLFPMEERNVPASAVEGEMLSKTQRVPTKPEPFVRQKFSEETVTSRSEAARKAVLEQLKDLNYGDRFTPPSTKGTVVFPGFAGGAEWGGAAYDPETHLYYINANEMAWILRLVPPRAEKRTDLTSKVYLSRCASCHRPDKKGAPPEYPAVDALAGKMTAEQLANVIRKGSGRMPGFAQLGEPVVQGLTAYLLEKKDTEVTLATRPRPPIQLKYTSDGYHQFTDPDGYPANSPPWGTLSAINLDTGDYAWKVPLGEYPELAAQGIKDTGTWNHGGGIVTAGGLFFIGATHYDSKFRAFDKANGKLLWETKLPFSAPATPAMYEWKGKQYILVPAGGGRGKPSGGTFVAYALP